MHKHSPAVPVCRLAHVTACVCVDGGAVVAGDDMLVWMRSDGEEKLRHPTVGRVEEMAILEGIGVVAIETVVATASSGSRQLCVFYHNRNPTNPLEGQCPSLQAKLTVSDAAHTPCDHTVPTSSFPHIPDDSNAPAPAPATPPSTASSSHVHATTLAVHHHPHALAVDSCFVAVGCVDGALTVWRVHHSPRSATTYAPNALGLNISHVFTIHTHLTIDSVALSRELLAVASVTDVRVFRVMCSSDTMLEPKRSVTSEKNKQEDPTHCDVARSLHVGPSQQQTQAQRVGVCGGIDTVVCPPRVTADSATVTSWSAEKRPFERTHAHNAQEMISLRAPSRLGCTQPEQHTPLRLIEYCCVLAVGVLPCTRVVRVTFLPQQTHVLAVATNETIRFFDLFAGAWVGDSGILCDDIQWLTISNHTMCVLMQDCTTCVYLLPTATLDWPRSNTILGTPSMVEQFPPPVLVDAISPPKLLKVPHNSLVRISMATYTVPDKSQAQFLETSMIVAHVVQTNQVDQPAPASTYFMRRDTATVSCFGGDAFVPTEPAGHTLSVPKLSGLAPGELTVPGKSQSNCAFSSLPTTHVLIEQALHRCTQGVASAPSFENDLVNGCVTLMNLTLDLFHKTKEVRFRTAAESCARAAAQMLCLPDCATERATSKAAELIGVCGGIPVSQGWGMFAAEPTKFEFLCHALCDFKRIEEPILQTEVQKATFMKFVSHDQICRALCCSRLCVCEPTALPDKAKLETLWWEHELQSKRPTNHASSPRSLPPEVTIATLALARGDKDFAWVRLLDAISTRDDTLQLTFGHNTEQHLLLFRPFREHSSEGHFTIAATTLIPPAATELSLATMDVLLSGRTFSSAIASALYQSGVVVSELFGRAMEQAYTEAWWCQQHSNSLEQTNKNSHREMLETLFSSLVAQLRWLTSDHDENLSLPPWLFAWRSQRCRLLSATNLWPECELPTFLHHSFGCAFDAPFTGTTTMLGDTIVWTIARLAAVALRLSAYINASTADVVWDQLSQLHDEAGGVQLECTDANCCVSVRDLLLLVRALWLIGVGRFAEIIQEWPDFRLSLLMDFTLWFFSENDACIRTVIKELWQRLQACKTEQSKQQVRNALKRLLIEIGNQPNSTPQRLLGLMPDAMNCSFALPILVHKLSRSSSTQNPTTAHKAKK